MCMPRVDKIAVKEPGYGMTQTAARAPRNAHSLERAKAEMYRPCRVAEGQRH